MMVRYLLKKLNNYLNKMPKSRKYKSRHMPKKARQSKKSRKPRKKSVKRRSGKTVKQIRAECKRKGLVYDPKTKRCRKRKSRVRKSNKKSRARKSKFRMKDDWSKLPSDPLHHVLSYGSRGTHAAGDIYGPHSQERGYLQRRMRGWEKIQRLVKRNQRVQVALPGYPVNSRINEDQILSFMGESAQLTTRQRQELRRLLARAYTHKEDGYEDAWLFGEGPMATTSYNYDEGRAASPAERKARRRAILAGSGNTLSVNGHNLPLPLAMLRKGRTVVRADFRSNKYPKNDQGNVDETHDMFWPETRSAARKFLHRKPTLVEIAAYGW